MELIKKMIIINNPYELLILVRDNKYLFSYFITADIRFKDDVDKWTLIGYSDAGKAEVTKLSSGIYKFSLPINAPYEIPISPVANMVETVNHAFEGSFTVSEDKQGNVIVNYVLHSDLVGLDLALAKFYEEKRIMDNNFDALEEVFEKMKSGMKDMMGMGMMGGPKDPSPNSNKEQPKEDLWSTLENLDSVELGDLEDTKEDLNKEEPESKEDTSEDLPDWDGDGQLM